MTRTEDSIWNLQGAEHRSLAFRILFLADSIQIRALMGANSLGWALYLAADPGAFERPFYADMRAFAPAWVWALAYAAHGLGAFWRIRDKQERVLAALIVNGWGVVVWGFAIYFQLLGAGHWAPSVTADLGSTFMLVCAFISSGWNRSSTST